MKLTTIIIGGGDSYQTQQDYLQALTTFEPRFSDGISYWKTNLITQLSDTHNVLIPRMPCVDNAKYTEWKIVFDKVLAATSQDIILVGHSLGANFLQAYLAEHQITKTIHQLHFVAGCISEGDFPEARDWDQVNRQAKRIHIWHSEDDHVVPYESAVYYNLKLEGSILHCFQNKGHFNGQTEFPELLDQLKN
jgi:predicted alpha/beta hydrolase family esterase